MPSQTLKCEVVPEGADEQINDATMIVTLEDTTFADEAAEPVQTEVLQHISFDPKLSETIPLSLQFQVPDLSRRYTLRVHLDADADGTISRGDYINV